MKDKDWIKSLEEGKYYEDLALSVLVYYNYDSYELNNTSDYDIKTIKDDVIIKYEVKADKWAYKTGNIFIEFESNRKKSGISITNADYYLIFEVVNKEQYNLYEIPLSKLKELCKVSKIKKNSGYNGLSCGYLLKKDKCQEYLKMSTIKKICLL